MTRHCDPKDKRDFTVQKRATLVSAVADLSWLLTRGYPPSSAQKLVGDKYQLTRRQRAAMTRSACSDTSKARRKRNRVAALHGPVYIDTLNLLILLERANGGGLILRGRDKVLRDLAGVHGSYRLQADTETILAWCMAFLSQHPGCSPCWLIDRPVSNSLRLFSLIQSHGATVELCPDPDRRMIEAQHCVITSDALILDQVPSWYPLAEKIIEKHIPNPWIFNLGGL